MLDCILHCIVHLHSITNSHNTGILGPQLAYDLVTWLWPFQTKLYDWTKGYITVDCQFIVILARYKINYLYMLPEHMHNIFCMNNHV